MPYKNIFTTKQDVDDYRDACKISVEILKQLKANVSLTSSPLQINNLAEKLCQEYKVKPSFKGVPGPKNPFPGAVCVSRNDETLHTIPFSTVPFQNGDIVKVDFGIIYKGFFTDHCITLPVGDITEEENRLISTAKLCIDTAVKYAVAGNRVGDISNALETICELSNLNYIEGYAGHGIGKSIHENPSVPYYGRKGSGPVLIAGMVLCIENQISLGTGRLKLDKDGWTLRTADGSKSAMFEHMVLVGKKAPEILTRL